ncbi:solute carrier family 35 member B1 [Octopus bimaculoides]|uniref:Solute carrier family 35 member B1 n=1 Tax=Octopus bimaculoides TaxID=37653 RepID=A0A0L8GI39_OCTBM|nr:solute carrier family 35 member B1 [Octopus bimaculoides]|eukprot:XP_014780800.1 PREDICTED: solute carrier family 35 member B1-like [Octopus bimaculoides]
MSQSQREAKLDFKDTSASARQVSLTIERNDMATENKRMLFFCSLGILVCYFFYGILQEKITKGKYGEGENQEKFTYTLALVFIQCIINVVASKLSMSVFHSPKDSTPKILYALCSLTYLLAMLASNHSLQHVNYPTQVLGKSVKPIPVMILGVLLARKRYPAAKYLCVLLIVTGVALFLYKDSKAEDSKPHAFGMGEILLLISLTMDGLTGAIQDRMRAKAPTNAHNMMFFMNAFSVLWLLFGLIFTGEGIEFVSFTSRHPSVLLGIFAFGIASALGQTFIFLTVSKFGPLTCSILTTTRKFFTILTSVIIFQNPLSQRQWIGTIMVFTGLTLDNIYGKQQKQK